MLHAVVINGVIGLSLSALFLVFDGRIYGAMGGQGASLHAAVAYSNVVFSGAAVVWLMNALASVVRGTGHAGPSLAICAGVVLLVALSPLLIFGTARSPPPGYAGGGLAVVLTSAVMTGLLGWYVLSVRCLVRFRWVKPRGGSQATSCAWAASGR